MENNKIKERLQRKLQERQATKSKTNLKESSSSLTEQNSPKQLDDFVAKIKAAETSCKRNFFTYCSSNQIKEIPTIFNLYDSKNDKHKRAAELFCNTIISEYNNYLGKNIPPMPLNDETIQLLIHEPNSSINISIKLIENAISIFIQHKVTINIQNNSIILQSAYFHYFNYQHNDPETITISEIRKMLTVYKQQFFHLYEQLSTNLKNQKGNIKIKNADNNEEKGVTTLLQKIYMGVFPIILTFVLKIVNNYNENYVQIISRVRSINQEDLSAEGISRQLKDISESVVKIIKDFQTSLKKYEEISEKYRHESSNRIVTELYEHLIFFNQFCQPSLDLIYYLKYFKLIEVKKLPQQTFTQTTQHISNNSVTFLPASATSLNIVDGVLARQLRNCLVLNLELSPTISNNDETIFNKTNHFLNEIITFPFSLPQTYIKLVTICCEFIEWYDDIDSRFMAIHYYKLALQVAKLIQFFEIPPETEHLEKLKDDYISKAYGIDEFPTRTNDVNPNNTKLLKDNSVHSKNYETLFTKAGIEGGRWSIIPTLNGDIYYLTNVRNPSRLKLIYQFIKGFFAEDSILITANGSSLFIKGYNENNLKQAQIKLNSPEFSDFIKQQQSKTAVTVKRNSSFSSSPRFHRKSDASKINKNSGESSQQRRARKFETLLTSRSQQQIEQALHAQIKQQQLLSKKTTSEIPVSDSNIKQGKLEVGQELSTKAHPSTFARLTQQLKPNDESSTNEIENIKRYAQISLKKTKKLLNNYGLHLEYGFTPEALKKQIDLLTKQADEKSKLTENNLSGFNKAYDEMQKTINKKFRNLDDMQTVKILVSLNNYIANFFVAMQLLEQQMGSSSNIWYRFRQCIIHNNNEISITGLIFLVKVLDEYSKDDLAALAQNRNAQKAIAEILDSYYAPDEQFSNTSRYYATEIEDSLHWLLELLEQLTRDDPGNRLEQALQTREQLIENPDINLSAEQYQNLETLETIIGLLIKIGEAYARLLECSHYENQATSINEDLSQSNSAIRFLTEHLQKGTGIFVDTAEIKIQSSVKEFCQSCKNFFRNVSAHEVETINKPLFSKNDISNCLLTITNIADDLGYYQSPTDSIASKEELSNVSGVSLLFN